MSEAEQLYHVTIHLKSGGILYFNHMKEFKWERQGNRIVNMNWTCSDRTNNRLSFIDLELVAAITVEDAKEAGKS
jgi:hypothetical protein